MTLTGYDLEAHLRWLKTQNESLMAGMKARYSKDLAAEVRRLERMRRRHKSELGNLVKRVKRLQAEFDAKFGGGQAK